MRPPVEVSRVIRNLKNSQSSHYNFDTFVNWLKTLQSEAQKRSQAERDDVIVRWEQGRLQTLDEILKEIEMCEERLKVIKDGS